MIQIHMISSRCTCFICFEANTTLKWSIHDIEMYAQCDECIRRMHTACEHRWIWIGFYKNPLVIRYWTSLTVCTSNPVVDSNKYI
jgi:hypothetical protein